MKTLKFTCPDCGKHELGSVEQVILTYPITNLNSDGDFDYDYDNPTAGDGEVLSYRCMNCGYELKNELGNTIQDCVEAVQWLKAKDQPTDTAFDIWYQENKHNDSIQRIYRGIIEQNPDYPLMFTDWCKTKYYPECVDAD